MAVALLLALEGAALASTAPVPEPGPLLLCTQVAVVHLALLMPALGTIALVWFAFASAVAVSIVVMGGYGHAVTVVGASAALVFSAAACGGAVQRFDSRRLYLASITCLLAIPFACAYLIEEFGSTDAASAAGGWRALSPLAGPSAGAILLLWAWPVAAIVRSRRA